MLDKILEKKAEDSFETSLCSYLTNVVSYRKTVVFEATFVWNSTLKFLANEECWNMRLTVMRSKESAL